MKNILECWPFPFKPRNKQIVALNWLEAQDARYLLLESPVGSGKSAIGLTYSIWLAQFKQPMFVMDKNGGKDIDPSEVKNSFILTPQRMLQMQYEASVKGNKKINMESLYGRANYECQSHKTTCDIGKEIRPSCSICPCNIARERAQQADEAVMNYALALNSFAYTDGFNPRNLIILDECHTVEEHLVSFGTLAVQKGRCEKYKLPFLIPEHIKEAYDWVKDEYAPKLNIQVIDMKAKYDELKERRNLKSKEKKYIKEFITLAKHAAKTKSTMRMDFNFFNREFVFTKDQYKGTFEFKRLYGREPFQDILAPMGERFLFMSSTILDKDGFCDDLGLENSFPWIPNSQSRIAK